MNWIELVNVFFLQWSGSIFSWLVLVLSHPFPWHQTWIWVENTGHLEAPTLNVKQHATAFHVKARNIQFGLFPLCLMQDMQVWQIKKVFYFILHNGELYQRNKKNYQIHLYYQSSWIIVLTFLRMLLENERFIIVHITK